MQSGVDSDGIVPISRPDNLWEADVRASDVAAAVGLDDEDGEEVGIAGAVAVESAGVPRAEASSEEDGSDGGVVGEGDGVICSGGVDPRSGEVRGWVIERLGGDGGGGEGEGYGEEGDPTLRCRRHGKDWKEVVVVVVVVSSDS